MHVDCGSCYSVNSYFWHYSNNIPNHVLISILYGSFTVTTIMKNGNYFIFIHSLQSHPIKYVDIHLDIIHIKQNYREKHKYFWIFDSNRNSEWFHICLFFLSYGRILYFIHCFYLFIACWFMLLIQQNFGYFRELSIQNHFTLT